MADSNRQQRIRCGKAKNQVKLSRQGCRRALVRWVQLAPPAVSS
jgi:hypothetical protein